MSANSFRRPSVAAISALVATVLLAAFSALPSASLAAPAAQNPTQPPSITVPAGGTVTVKVRGFCLVFGKPFPTDSTSVNGLGTANARQALYYAIQKGYTDSNAAQVQEAIWFTQDGIWHDPNHVIGQEIIDNAASAGAIPTGSGTAINEQSIQSSGTYTARFVPQNAEAFYGDGDLIITNSGTSAAQVYVPIGAKFTVPGSNGQFQDLLVYALQPAGGTPTAGATTTAATTVVATTTTAATTPAATTTTAPTVGSAATSTTAPTADPSSTTAPVATAAAQTPTVAVAATSTSAPTVAAMATPTTGVLPSLPNTGNTEDGTSVFLVIASMVCVLAGLGLVMRSRLKMR